MSRAAAALLITVSFLASGCLGSDTQAASSESSDPFVIDDPNDFSYLDDVNASQRPHIHDYWGGQTKLTLADGPTSWSGSNVGGTSSTFGGPDLKIPDGNMVIPGTRWVNITATWKNERPSTVEFLIEYKTANGSKGLLKLPSGQTVSIEVSEEMNDLAHAKQTRWSFSPKGTGSGPAWSAEIKAQVLVEIVKTPGPLPYAPAHRDPWGQNKTAVLFDQSGNLVEPTTSTTGTDRPPVSPLLLPVPVESSTIFVRFFYNSTTPTQFHYDPVLDYRGADKTTYNTAGKPQKRNIRNVDGFLEWQIEVKPENWDSPYASQSDWRVTIYWAGEAGNAKASQGANYMQGNYHLQVVVER